MDETALEAVRALFEESWRKGVDFGFQGERERAYTEAFSAFQGGGFTDAVATGTAALYVAVAALNPEPGDDILVSPVTDPGCVSAILLHGAQVVVADAAPGEFNVDPDTFERALTPRTRIAVLTHLGGKPLAMEPIMAIARSRGVAVVEDCSQAHGADWRGEKVGRFGDVAAFSTMFGKAHASGGCGGLVHTRDERVYWRVRSLADRGKPFDDPGFQPKNPAGYRFPALNLNLDELSCAIGLTTLDRLAATVIKRTRLLNHLCAALSESRVVTPRSVEPEADPSWFFGTLAVDERRLTVTKRAFAEAVAAEGIWINPDYRYVISEWPWLQDRVRQPMATPNAIVFRDASFNVLFHEAFTEADMTDVAEAILKVERALSR